MAYKRRKGKAISKAKKYMYKGVNYKSGLERKMAELLTEAKIPFKYEPTKFNLMESFWMDMDCYEKQANGKGEFKNRGNKKILPISYTPDFIGDGFIIETKGWANEEFRNKWKMFKNYCRNNRMDVTLFKPQNQKECLEVVEIIKALKHERKQETKKPEFELRNIEYHPASTAEDITVSVNEGEAITYSASTEFISGESYYDTNVESSRPSGRPIRESDGRGECGCQESDVCDNS